MIIPTFVHTELHQPASDGAVVNIFDKIFLSLFWSLTIFQKKKQMKKINNTLHKDETIIKLITFFVKE